MEDFEKELDAKDDDGDPKYTRIELVNYSDTASDVSSFTISEPPAAPEAPATP